MKPRVTQKTIADALGLSSSTVGLVLGSCKTRSTKKLNEKTVERIRDKARELGYQPHRAAQLVRNGRSHVIGIVHFGGTSELGAAANRALAEAIQSAGYNYLAVDLNWHGTDAAHVDEAFNELIRARVDGVVISMITEALRPEHTERLRKAGIPVISVNGDGRMGIPLICDDVREAFHGLTRHLLDEGHRRLLLIIHDAPNRSMLMRNAGFRAAMEGVGPVEKFTPDTFANGWKALCESGSPCGGILQLPTPHSRQSFQHQVYHEALAFLRAPHKPDAVLATNDSTAFGIHAAALECGKSIPGDLALTGYGNNSWSAYPAYHLTTIHPHIERSCVAAVGQLVDHLHGSLPCMENRTFPAELIFRRSSTRPTPPTP